MISLNSISSQSYVFFQPTSAALIQAKVPGNVPQGQASRNIPKKKKKVKVHNCYILSIMASEIRKKKIPRINLFNSNER